MIEYFVELAILSPAKAQDEITPLSCIRRHNRDFAHSDLNRVALQGSGLANPAPVDVDDGWHVG